MSRNDNSGEHGHEIRTLNGMIGLIDLLNKTSLDVEQQYVS
jgi:hypothetical protein